jgi:hypothetical protein
MITIEQKLGLLGMKPIYGSYLPLAPDEISRIEHLVGSELPPDYKAFISKFGCAYFPDSEVAVRPISRPLPGITDTGLLEISAILGGGNKGHRVLLTLELLRGRMPENMVPIADDHSANVFCLEAGKTGRGAVYFWSSMHEPSGEDYVSKGMLVPDDLLFQNLTHVAESFSDFFMRLEQRSS